MLFERRLRRYLTHPRHRPRRILASRHFKPHHPQHIARGTHLHRNARIGIEQRRCHPAETSAREFARKSREMHAPGAAVVGGLRSVARKYRLGRYPRFPTRRAFEPVVGSTGISFPRLKAIRRALDDTGFPAPAPDQRVNRRSRDRNCLKLAPRLDIGPAGLEYLPQQVVGRDGPDAPSRKRIPHHVIGAAPRMFGAPPHRRLVDGCGKAARRRCGKTSDEARPGHIVEMPDVAAHACDFEMAPETGERPVKRTCKPWVARLLARERRTAPLIAAVEKPDTGNAGGIRDRLDLTYVRRPRTPEPSAGDA